MKHDEEPMEIQDPSCSWASLTMVVSRENILEGKSLIVWADFGMLSSRVIWLIYTLKYLNKPNIVSLERFYSSGFSV